MLFGEEFARPVALALTAFRPCSSLAIAPRFAEFPLAFASRLPRFPLELPRFEFPPFSANAGVAETLIATAGAAVASNTAISVLVADFVTLIIKISLPSHCWAFAPPQLTTFKRYKRGNSMAKMHPPSRLKPLSPQEKPAYAKLTQNLYEKYNEKRPTNCGAFSFLGRVAYATDQRSDMRALSICHRLPI